MGIACLRTCQKDRGAEHSEGYHYLWENANDLSRRTLVHAQWSSKTYLRTHIDVIPLQEHDHEILRGDTHEIRVYGGDALTLDARTLDARTLEPRRSMK
jgi:hypothetical protein